MIEFPEARVIAGQMREALQGRRIIQVVRGNVVHKFAFYNHMPDEYFLISKPGIWGIGNGCLQDILFRARLHPRHPAAALDVTERRRLYDSIRSTLEEMVDLGGRDCETDLIGRAGGYHRLMCNETAGQPCSTWVHRSRRPNTWAARCISAHTARVSFFF